jgi:SAM-dependent methyltransferase
MIRRTNDYTSRFSGRGRYYSRGRPGYPPGILTFLGSHSDFTRDSVVADIGSGTGKLSELFLANGNVVYGVEPNEDMRLEAERILSREARFHSVVGTAEKTDLGNGSVDLVTAGQSFHWFDPPRAKEEFARILRPPGFVLLVWNTRKTAKGTFGHDYENLLERHRSRLKGWSSSRDEIRQVTRFFGSHEMVRESLENSQDLDYRQMLARVRSASYMPRRGPNYAKVKKVAKSLFERYEHQGRVTMSYTTDLYFGRILPP